MIDVNVDAYHYPSHLVRTLRCIRISSICNCLFVFSSCISTRVGGVMRLEYGVMRLHPSWRNTEWCSKPRSEFGQKLAPASRRAANYTLISLLDDRRRHGDHILGTMHTKRGFCLGWLNTDTFLEKCEGGGFLFPKKKNSVLKSYI